MKWATVGWLLGLVTCLAAAAMLAPMVLAIALGEPWQPFAAGAALGALVGGLALFLLRSPEPSLDHRSAFLVVTLAWLIACCTGAVPYLLSPEGGLGPVDALFESVSGFTTTGATVLPHLESQPRSLLLWRAMTQWIGGMGVMLIGVAILPVLGVGGMSLYKAEAPGPSKDKLVPRISETVKILWILYLGLTVIGVLALRFDGMSLFDALCHTMSAISTGGFSTHDRSLGYTSSGLILVTTTLLMVVGGTSFAVIHRALTRGLAWKENTEFRVYVGILLVASFIIAIDLRLGMAEQFPSSAVALEHAAFQVASIVTTTGYTTTDYDLWPSTSHAMLFALFFVGGMAGSTAGGVKVIRVVLFVRLALSHFFYLIHPRGVMRMKLGDRVVEPEVLNSVASFMAIWATLIMLGTVLFALLGLDLFTAFSASVTTLGNVGPAFQAVGPSYTWEFFEPAQKLLASSWMILGRLEVYTVLVIFTPGFWRF